ncbi:hypothetical protein [Mitsuaria sp. GD03876]|uniref:SDH family Clp fold serine proteinase n=1 Tax=Mitsuaria sp. GD03876 TaxID=2975399 RepID=UPI00244A6C83|nr:hypothetical protein [Mitsuaria sp. GD03876]MDH0866780.1 hypothetical protein [Mitsuaria sp. GD03876]
MAVLLKEASPATDATQGSERLPNPASLVPPFDVVTYAGPITVEGYERLSALLEERRTHASVLVVLETPGGDPHAAFRIARALGFHYDRVEALIPRYCKSAGTLIVLGASTLHMDDLGELGPLDMQVPRVNEATRQASALEFSETLDLLWTQQMQCHAESMRQLTDHGLSPVAAALAAADFIEGVFHPIAQQVDPVHLVAMSRAMTLAVAYGERLAFKGQNIASAALLQLVYGYPSHSFVIDRKEAQRLFFDVRAPEDAIAEIARWCRTRASGWSMAETPDVHLHTFPFSNLELPHAQEDSRSHRPA